MRDIILEFAGYIYTGTFYRNFYWIGLDLILAPKGSIFLTFSFKCCDILSVMYTSLYIHLYYWINQCLIVL